MTEGRKIASYSFISRNQFLKEWICSFLKERILLLKEQILSFKSWTPLKGVSHNSEAIIKAWKLSPMVKQQKNMMMYPFTEVKFADKR